MVVIPFCGACACTGHELKKMKYLLTAFSRYSVRMFHNDFVLKPIPRIGSLPRPCFGASVGLLRTLFWGFPGMRGAGAKKNKYLLTVFSRYCVRMFHKFYNLSQE